MIFPLLIAIGLNIDTFSVAVVQGSQVIKPTIKDSLKVGLFFGIGQAGMALLGSFLGLGFKLLITNIDHWIAFILLGLIGGKLIYDSYETSDCNKKTDICNFKELSLLVIATSIDALVVGVTFAFIKNPIVINILIIGVVTFFVSFIGYLSGRELKKICKSKVKIIGGIILIIIGIKILIQHLFFGS